MVYARSIQYNGLNGFWTDAPIALLNSGGKFHLTQTIKSYRTFVASMTKMSYHLGIRANIDIGNITRYEIMNVLPFDSRLVVTQLTGRDLLTTLENSVRR